MQLLKKPNKQTPNMTHNHHHLSFNREGRWGTTDDFSTSFLHFSMFSTALWDLPNSRPVHSLMLSNDTKCEQTYAENPETVRSPSDSTVRGSDSVYMTGRQKRAVKDVLSATRHKMGYWCNM